MPSAVVDSLLTSPLLLLREQSPPPAGEEGLQLAYSILQPYYYEHLETAWPRLLLAKCGQKSAKYRSAGNTCFSKQRLRDCLRLYSQAVVWAPPASGELAMALANRSAGNFECGNYPAALADIEAALATGAYPTALHYKLQLRQAFCLKELGRTLEAREALAKAKELIEVAHLEAEKEEEVDALMEHTLELLGEAGEDSEEMPSPRSDLCGVSSPHPLLPSLSSSLAVAHSPLVGRHLLAARDIAVGEVVAVEEATVCRLLPLPGLLTTCCHCLRESWAPLPCPGCAAVTFCSVSCRTAALASHHKWECGWALGDLATAGGQGEELASSSMWLAARALTQTKVGWMLDNRQMLQQLSARHNVGEGAKIEEELDEQQKKYRDLFNLVTHMDQSITEEEGEAFQQKHTVLAVLLLCLLESSGWLEEHSCRGWSREKGVVAGQLYHLLAVVKFNTHQTGQFDQFCLSSGYTASSTGQAIRPALALANHSCNPNMVRADRGRWVVAAACHNIVQGEEVTDSYGPTFMEEERPERRARLKADYWFPCRCTACSSNWPCTNDLAATLFEVRECQLKLPRADTGPHAALMDRYIRGVYEETRKELEQPEGGDMQEATKLWRLYSLALGSLVSQPYLGYCKLFQGVRNCLWLTHGAKALHFYEDSKALLK